MNTERNLNTVSAGKTAWRRLPAVMLGFLLAMGSTGTTQASVDVSNTPLFLTQGVDPNITFVLDDSGSMQWEFMPDEDMNFSTYMFPRPANLYGGSTYSNQVPTFKDTNVHNFFGRSAANNMVFYNPDITYVPWSNSDGTSMSDADPSAAYYNPRITALGTLDLTAQQTQAAVWFSHATSLSNANCDPCNGNHTFWPITYFNYLGGNKLQLASYQKVQITSATPVSANFTSPNGTVRTRDQEIQNFANWFQFYRSRILAARAGIGRAFSQQGEGMRVGFGAINKGSTSVDGVTTNTLINGVRPFTGTARDDFFDNLYDHVIPTSGTPLRRALDDAGQYFSRTDNLGPWGKVPGSNDTSAHLQCRQSYTILMTDGYWNGAQAGTAAARANNDGTGGPTITGPDSQSFTYSDVSPFTDGWVNTLADVAMYYWKNDLRTDLVNEVPVSPLDPAFWQHMVTFGVGLGVTGSVDPAAAFNAIGDTSTTISWPQPSTSGTTENIDDLLHAGVNSRGGFFSAADPDTFASELGAVLDAIVARVESSSTSAAASSAMIQSTTKLFTAGFRSTDWSGMLAAKQINSDGSVGSTVWDAETELGTRTPASRDIYTSNDTTNSGVVLALANLSVAQQAALDYYPDGTNDGLGGERIDWLRGDESAHASFRSRSGSGAARLLGDITNSDPQFVGKRDFGYSLLSTLGPSYTTFRTTTGSDYDQRPEVIYAGANDGMLHAFHADTGAEIFAYMPSELLLPEGSNSFAPINRLMQQDYNHRYFMDGTVAVGDAHATTWADSTSGWKSVLVGTMGAGGRTVFALDVTAPQSFTDSNILWEFTDPDLGYGVSEPSIVRMRNGDWAAVFGNGYNSDNHRAVLFVVRLSDGALLAKIDTGVGNATTENGLATPKVTDWPGMDLEARAIYAGDLQGNMWRFDVDHTNPTQWTNSSNYGVLFAARDSGNSPQPITARPEVAIYPNDPSSLMVLFGTGSYFRSSDAGSNQVQTLYGIIDDSGAAVSGRADLLEQTIDWEGTHTFGSNTFNLREISQHAIGSNNEKGWYMDLIYQGNALGERVVSAPSFPSGSIQTRVRFTTLIPDDDPCGTGRRGFLMDFLLGSGGRTGQSVFDLNSDGNFDAGDMAHTGEVINGREFGKGEEPAVIRDGNVDRLYDGEGEGGGGSNEAGPAGRQSWWQIR